MGDRQLPGVNWLLDIAAIVAVALIAAVILGTVAATIWRIWQGIR